MNEKLKRLRKNVKKQTINISIAAGNYDTEIIIDLINQTIQDFRVKYQESSIGFENLAYLQSIENKCNSEHAVAVFIHDPYHHRQHNRYKFAVKRLHIYISFIFYEEVPIFIRSFLHLPKTLIFILLGKLISK